MHQGYPEYCLCVLTYVGRHIALFVFQSAVVKARVCFPDSVVGQVSQPRFAFRNAPGVSMKRSGYKLLILMICATAIFTLVSLGVLAQGIVALG